MDLTGKKLLMIGFSLICVFMIYDLNAQNKKFEFSPPLDIPMYLSGNFGEIRSNHFHTGIDIKTQGVIGHKVYAISDGYVSRIKVQANGYGKALYITHLNGYTSVYGHLDAFRADIRNYVTNNQYNKKSFETDIYLDAKTFKVKQGEMVAFSGNSGGSSGPHLHFEIRDQNQHPLNVLKFPIDIKDNVAPVFRSLVFYPLEGGQVYKGTEKILLATVKNDTAQSNIYTIRNNPVEVYGRFGLGVEVYDYLNGSRNRCGIYNLEMELDGRLINQFALDYLSFGTVRYLNAHIDYAEKVQNNRNIHKLYLLPNNRLHLYNYLNNDGSIMIKDNLVHDVSIVVKDAYGNSSKLMFEIKGIEKQQFFDNNEQIETKKMYYDRINTYSLNSFNLEIPKNALYDNIDFKLMKLPGDEKYYSSFYIVHDEMVPLQKYMTIAIKPDTAPKGMVNKMCLAMIENEGEPVYVGGEWKKGFIEASSRDFGRYVVMIDSIAPKIIPVNFKGGEDISGKENIRIIVKDEFSGIKEYKGYIDGKWALFEYDKKNDLLIHKLDEERFGKGKKHDLTVVVEDYHENKEELKTSFFW